MSTEHQILDPSVLRESFALCETDRLTSDEIARMTGIPKWVWFQGGYLEYASRFPELYRLTEKAREA